ncbi:MAG: prepilin-type N-terminal cleavage/methylation domain-containing protein [Candidatus Caenarcaniphilales bacterium]|nr:prepilin-type N-terminal cleavage/methylation domain-containing protein [Candidatus Caenarcaniphilales bacterium]
MNFKFNNSHTLRNSSGVTLAELLISLAIISLVIFSIINFYSTNLLNNSKELKRSQLYYRAVEEMESIIAKDYSSSELRALNTSSSNIKFIDDGKYLLKVKVESIDPRTGISPEIYPITIEEAPLLKKITISAVNLEDAEYPQKARQIDLVRYISP